VRHLRMVGLCLVAVLAVAAVAATSASALPEWGQCYAKAGGKYADSNCQKKAALGKGTFEWRKGTEVVNKKFSGANVGSGGVLTSNITVCEKGTHAEKRVPRSLCEAGGGTPEEIAIGVECEAEENRGEVSGTKEVKNVAVKFHGCHFLGGSISCANSTNEGEIIVNPLKGALGYINKAKKEVGVLLEPAIKHGEFAKFSCAGAITTVVGVGNKKEGAAYSPETTGGYDGIISPIAPVNTSTTALTQTYTVNASNENIPSKFEGKHIELLEDYIFNTEEPENQSMWSKAGEAVTNVNHQEGGEEIEIKA
jgi:hypothetical protein